MPELSQTFVFADLAGFTALTEAHGDEQAADLVGDFCAAVRELLPRYGAEDVKSIGDALMLRCPDAAGGVGLGLAVVADIGARHGYPIVRVGMHTGPAIERDGDWFGGTVNLAARVSGAAGGGEVLLTEATHQAAGDPDDVRFVDRGHRRFKNVAAPVLLFAALPASAESGSEPSWQIDPVCRMSIDPGRAVGSLRYLDREYHFCSLACAHRFSAEPDLYSAAGDEH